MRKVVEKKFHKKITKNFSYSFAISDSDLYLIEITASAKSWLQNFIKLRSFFRDDDLSLKIDGRIFPKLDGRRGLFDGEAAWNGNNLKGLSKTNAFFINLDKGEHTLYFFADQKPILEHITIYSLENEKEISYIPPSNPPQDGNRRQWITLIAVDLSVKSLNITAKAQEGRTFSLFKRDDSDLKLVIDGEIQRNDEPKSHPHWYWCGRTLKEDGKTFSRDLNLSDGQLHYIEFWADRTPILEKVELIFSEQGKTKEKDASVMPYIYKGVKGDEDYNRYDAIIKEVVDYWNNEFLNDTDPPKEILDPNLIKAMIYQESRVGYYLGAEIDVLQVGDPDDPALRTLKGELKEYWIHNGKQVVLEYPDVKNTTVRDSIYWGVRWLYHKAQGITTDGGRYWRTWKEAVHGYGPGIKEYADSIWHIYKNGIKKEGSNIIRLWEIALVLLLSGFLLWGQNETEVLKSSIVDFFSLKQQPYIQDIEVKFYKNNPSLFVAVVEWEKDWWEELKIGTLNSGVIKWLEIKNPPSEASILSAQFTNLGGFSYPILEVYGKTHMGNGALYLYEFKNSKLPLIFETIAVDSHNENAWNLENYQKYGYTTCGQIYQGGKLSSTYRDINKDGVSDIVLEGKAIIICEKEIASDSFYYEATDVRISEIPVKKIYLWDKNSRVFIEEQINGV